jgi:hypothetical protein
MAGAVSPFLGRTLATVVAMLSIVSTAAGLWSAHRADQAKQQSEATQNAFEQLKLNKDYQLHIFELVDKSLSSTDGGLILASAYATSLDDAKLQKNLADAIRAVAAARKGGGGKPLSTEETVALNDLSTSVQQAAAGAAVAAAKPEEMAVAFLANASSDTGVKATVNTGKVNPLGWDVDVFACASRGAPSQALAQRIVDDLAAKARAGTTLGNQSLGRIRLRILSVETQKRGGFPTSTNEVRADIGEEPFADAVAAAVNAMPGAPAARFDRRTSKSKTPWYVSVFACA